MHPTSTVRPDFFLVDGCNFLQQLFEPCGGEIDLDEAIQEGFFSGVPASLIGSFSSWRTVLSGRWHDRYEILRGEGKSRSARIQACAPQSTRLAEANRCVD